MEGVTVASLTSLITNMKTAIAWIWTLFTRLCTTILTNDLLFYPVMLFIVIAVVGLVIKIVRSFGLKSRRS